MRESTIHLTDNRNHHQREVDSFIPAAMKEARAKVRATGKPFKYIPAKGGDKYKLCLKSKYFHEAMTRLTIAAGLRCA